MPSTEPVVTTKRTDVTKKKTAAKKKPVVKKTAAKRATNTSVAKKTTTKKSTSKKSTIKRAATKAAAVPPQGPRVFGIVATGAPVVAIIRRGPSDWCQVARLHLDTQSFESGAWFRGRLFPQKCDLSPDGRWLAYSAEKIGAEWAAGETYNAVSRLPWLHALAAWETGTTNTRGIHFVERGGSFQLEHPVIGDLSPFLKGRLALTEPLQFAVEQRRGWKESPTSPPRSKGGPWDEKRAASIEKARPGSENTIALRAAGSFAAFRSLPTEQHEADYELVVDGKSTLLPGVQWADWSPTGQLIVATDLGAIELHDGDRAPTDSPLFCVELAKMKPYPAAAPPEARRW